MSPVDLVRDRAIEDNPNWKDCPDWHWYVLHTALNFKDVSFISMRIVSLFIYFIILSYRFFMRNRLVSLLS
jgi:hypothetical protein